MRMNARRRLGIIAAYFVIVPVALFSTGPLFWTFLTSIKDPKISFAIPPVFFFRPTLESYRTLLQSSYYTMGLDFRGAALNSMIVAVASTLVTIIVACLAAYALSRFTFRGRGLIGFLILCTRMLPPIAAIIPMFVTAYNIGIIDTKIALVIAYTALNLPFSIWMLRGFLQDIPTELDEAAMIDGCTRLGALWRVLLPVIAPGLAATSVFTFLLAWNDLPIALALTIKGAKTLPVIMVSFSSDEGVAWGPLSAAATLVVIPAVIFVAAAQRHIVRGLTMGAIKG